MEGIKQVIFYNHFGAGDVFESREFVKDYMNILPPVNYYYAHGKNPRILLDIPNLSYTLVTEAMHPMNKVTISDDTIYINTWIGRESRYVLPGIGCTVEKLYEMHNNILYTLGHYGLTRADVYSYIPTIDFSKYNTSKIHEFLINNRSKRYVLISNGNVQSNQALNFDFTPVISRICQTFPEVFFIITQPIALDSQVPNLFNSGDIIQVPDFDLNEIAYLSLFTDTIIGRSSGPHTFSQHMDNWLDSKKVNLSFTYTKSGSHFVLSDHLPMKKEWSNATNEDEVFNKICEVVGR